MKIYISKTLKVATVVLAVVLVLVSCDKNDDDYNGGNPQPLPQATVIKGAGDSATVLNFINQFRLLLGDPVNLTTGVAIGRREVNWDGVPANLSNNNLFPLDFFNDLAGPEGRKRGLQYVPGSVLRVDTSKFVDIEPTYGTQFVPFSGRRIIISPNSTVTEIEFKVAGTNTPAFVRGFGVVFTDVDVANTTSIELFNGTKSLGVFKANAGGVYSFIGAGFADQKVTRVKITSGNAVLANGVKDISTPGGNKDVVAMDDFFYDEPKILE